MGSEMYISDMFYIPFATHKISTLVHTMSTVHCGATVRNYFATESRIGQFRFIREMCDHDLNMIVNFNDFVKLSNDFGNTGTGWDQGNGNTDDLTNFNDFVRLSNNFGMSFVSGSDIPEPMALALVAIGGLVVTSRRRV